MPNRQVILGAYVPVLIVTAILLGLFRGFVAEDAYIVSRYAENLVDSGELVYNHNEPMNALTSPLHALIEAALYALTGETMTAWRVLALALVLTAWGLMLREVGAASLEGLALTVVLILSPSVLLWTLGGLDTPLLLILVTMLTLLVMDGHPMRVTRLVTIMGLAGLLVVTRYDAVLYAGPVALVAAWRARSVRWVIGSVLVGAVLPAAWIVFATYFYGDPIPTSFYYKMSSRSIAYLLGSSFYIALFLVVSGLLPLALSCVWLVPRPRRVELLRAHIRGCWWMYAALLPVLVYALFAALTHMMFSFRLLVPFLPVFALLLVDLVRQAVKQLDSEVDRRRFARGMGIMLSVVVLAQVLQGYVLVERSVNGLSPVGEYANLGVRDYVKFMATLEQNAVDIATHWDTLPLAGTREPRVWTAEGGILPYVLSNAYVYTGLVAYRHNCQVYMRYSADYIHILVPHHGTISQQLGSLVAQVELVSSHDLFFDGRQAQLNAYYNPNPSPHILSDRIDRACQ